MHCLPHHALNLAPTEFEQVTLEGRLTLIKLLLVYSLLQI
jgi:hypothetical protein